MAPLLTAPWLYFFGLASAFDYVSHEATGQTAVSAIDDIAISNRLKKLLGGKEVTDIAGWGHQVDDTFPGVARLHFQLHDDQAAAFCGPVKERVARCPDNICLLAAIKHFYGKIREREGNKTDYPAIDFGKAASGLKFSDADSVKMLVNLIGDLHQPLHAGYVGDDAGRKVRVKLDGKEMTLYELWNKGLAAMIRKEDPSFWLGSWTHVEAIGDQAEVEQKLYRSEGAYQSFDRWMEESVTFACQNVYVVGDRWLAGPSAVDDVIDFKESGDYMRLKPLFLNQLLMAGVRIGLVLNDLLDPKKGASKLEEGSSVTTKADVEEASDFERMVKDRRRHGGKNFVTAPPARVSSNFLTNLVIAAIVVPVFFILVNWRASPAALSNLANRVAVASTTTSHSQPGRKRLD